MSPQAKLSTNELSTTARTCCHSLPWRLSLRAEQVCKHV